ncbi:G-type lectin S-receptor-like serine/threonine-protein kinase LECRK4 [Salvia hispanica]|uniref:G-type lectin S-receptor-like serine/threonine-protein kinase LECRK4 n=1 Tax=Salvia hispanica TaxID=49212 RepID=UPI00200906B8|nr:G-type lectin S-receptor-like serine/threonine-protein kinase LECRK4 [Salvia hispanica]
MAFRSSIILALLVLLYPHSTCSQTISVGSSLTAASNTNPWRSSPNGDFALGFKQLQPNTGLFLLAIWFDKIPDKTTVWYERSSYPVPRGSMLRLDSANGLILQDPQGRLLYNTSTGGPVDQVSHALLNDTGNFVIRLRDSSILWESFRHPTDTILPSQSIEMGDTLVSRRTEANFSVGRFYASISNNGRFIFNTKNVPSNSDYDDEYYGGTTSPPNASEAVIRAKFDSGALISLVRRNGQDQILSPRSIPLSSDNYYRATLDFDGIFTQYCHPKNFGSNPSWQIASSWPQNICRNINGFTGSGACGYNSVCRLVNQRPVCECPQGFSLADPSNPYGNCEPQFVQGCTDGGNEYDLVIIDDTDWPNNDYERKKPCPEEQCRIACQEDCFCDVSIYRDNSCWKKRLPLSNGRVDTSQGLKPFLKIRKRDVTLRNPRPRRDRQTLIFVISVLLGSSSFINCLFITAACVLLFFGYNRIFRGPSPVQDPSASNIRCFTYKELVQATDGFKDELGTGAFGIVYKGSIQNGLVAVKRLDRMFQDSDKEFKTEVNVIGRTHHKNLVSLIGFCEEGPHRLLVYEYMSNGTLADFLFGDLRASWSQRTQIAMGIAQGLTYLHEECSSQIIHCDIKPHNILLDEYYIARISDFGLAKLLTMNQSKTLTNIQGTKGYVAPEWFRNTQISNSEMVRIQF